MAIDYEKRGHVATVTLNRPDAMNALDPEMSRQLAEVWRDVRDDPQVWAAVVTGAGEKAFCAGADLKRLGEYYRDLTPFQRRQRGDHEPGLGGITRNLWVHKPIVAAINGYCLAGGLELALACDLRVAADHATFALTEVRWGIIPGAGGTQRLPRLVPVGIALEMILTAQPISAQRAYEVGLVNRVVPLGELMPTALKLAETICANAPLAVRTAKEAVWRGLHLSLEEGLRLEALLGDPLRETEDVQEGLRSFREKRRPEFKGR
ncbi:MAG: enoyl-CoA hydratase-related protein [Armatimonadota bacterium]|nr:enoyl-CoA hydratase-related protein [Armatimonadota bacterium]MDR7469496.1 enoyl-CoA hydratase-related protein [Armatimonadota bacterium]MDR7475447.1 enoyl-CoA hydratase-related protein [Armatimonadota bacterium]